MLKQLAPVTHLSRHDVDQWSKAKASDLYLGDVVDHTNAESMSVGFALYEPGAANDWVVTYDEALIVTEGAYSVTDVHGETTTARVGEVIFLRKGTKVVYSAGADGAKVVYVTYPHWVDAQEHSEHAGLLDTFEPLAGAPPV